MDTEDHPTPPEPPPDPRSGPRGPSLALRLLAAFLGLAVAFGAIVGWGLYRTRRALDEVRLLDEGYLRLALNAAELRATQSILLTLLDRILEEQDAAATRSWVEAVRRLRPDRLAELRGTLGRTRALARTDEDRRALDRLADDLDTLEADARAGDAALGRLFADLDAGRAESARTTLDELLARERAVDRGLRTIGREADRQVADLSAGLERDGSRTFWMLLGLALVAAGIAVGILVFVHAAVSPLRALERAVRAVARGDLSSRVGLRRHDEIGRLAAQFDRMTEAIRERDERLRALQQSEKLAALGRMAAHVTHEVRNPLSAIGLNTELLEEELGRTGAGDAARGMVQAIGREVERLTRVTQAYLSLARAPKPEMTAADVGTIAAETVDFHRPEAEAAGVRLSCEVADGLPAVRADTGQIRQVVANLLRNAIEAVASSAEKEVRVAVRPERDGVELSVRDTGPGLPAEARARLFEPFFTTKPQGTGIGLAGSRQIAVAHGGTLDGDTEGPGACFRLWLPGPDPALPSTAPSGKDSPPPPDGADGAEGTG